MSPGTRKPTIEDDREAVESALYERRDEQGPRRLMDADELAAETSLTVVRVRAVLADLVRLGVAQKEPRGSHKARWAWTQS